MQPEIPAGSIMIFLKHFDTSKQTLCGVGKVYVPRSSKVGDLASVINERMRWTPGTPLKLYEVGVRTNKEIRRRAYIVTGNQTGNDRVDEA